MPLKRHKVLESEGEEEKTETAKQWTDNRQSKPCASLIHRFIGCGRVLQPQTIQQERPTPSTSQLKLQNCDHCPQKGKQIQCHLCSTKGKKETRIRFKCPKGDVGLCVELDKI
jgi:hypothetical protein